MTLSSASNKEPSQPKISKRLQKLIERHEDISPVTSSSSSFTSLYSALSSLNFWNSGLVTSDQKYIVRQHGTPFYVEPENITTGPNYAWDTSVYNFTYLAPGEIYTGLDDCMMSEVAPGDLPGLDLTNFEMPTLNLTQCSTACCETAGCLAWVAAVPASPFNNCAANKSCCYLKYGTPTNSPLAGAYNGFCTRRTEVTVPPTGMRSAVPLGGIGAGAIEMRADGTFHEWTITNQSPGGSPKFGRIDTMVTGLRTHGRTTGSTFASVIRTHPTNNLPGVEAILYRGAYPVSRFDVYDEALPLKASLYAYSSLYPSDLDKSIRPSIVFSLNIANPTDEIQDVSFLLNLPMLADEDQTRISTSSDSILESFVTQTLVDCISKCASQPSCATWNWQNQLCTLNSVYISNNWTVGAYSGVNGAWLLMNDNTHKTTAKPRSRSPEPLICSRSGSAPTSGDINLWSSVESADGTPIDVVFSYGTGNDLNEIFNAFSINGTFAPQSGNKFDIYGAASVTASIPPNKQATLSIVFSWYFPNRDHVGKNIGNYYAKLFDNSSDVSDAMLGNEGQELTTLALSLGAAHSVWSSPSLPDFLVDYLINSISHFRSAIYSLDGTFRSWEAMDCTDIDSVHNDYQRHIPYILYFPETEVNKMRGWAKYQLPNGMIQETISQGCFGPTASWEDAGGRVMADVSTLFIAEVWELYTFTGEKLILDEFYPNVQAAARWQINVSPNGLPEYMIDTYDILVLASYQYCIFNSAIHLAAMAAVVRMATIMNDEELARNASKSFELGSQTIQRMLWYDEGRYYQSFGGDGSGNVHAVMSDSLYGQVVAYTLGLGSLLPLDQMKSHLDAEIFQNSSPYGLIVQTGRENADDAQDNAIWMGGSQDWSALAIRVFNDTNINDLLAESEIGLNFWRVTLANTWNTHGLAAPSGYGLDGLPICTSHYGFHMVLYHIVFSLNGQVSRLDQGTLTFEPRSPIPFTLPVILPNILGHITGEIASVGKIRYTFSIVIGSIQLQTLTIGNSTYPKVVDLQAGDSISWTDNYPYVSQPPIMTRDIIAHDLASFGSRSIATY